jgi:hypothetical protein
MQNEMRGIEPSKEKNDDIMDFFETKWIFYLRLIKMFSRVVAG